VIFMDMRMPIMNGLEACRLLRKQQDPNKQPLYIIGLTASHGPSEDHDCRKAGMDAVGAKPISRKSIRVWLDTCVFRQPTHILSCLQL
jgi:CheY-like chemotaxis protein